MPTKKKRKKAAKKPAEKRAPRQVWVTIYEGRLVDVFYRRREAEKLRGSYERVAGPYVLAERVRES